MDVMWHILFSLVFQYLQNLFFISFADYSAVEVHQAILTLKKLRDQFDPL